MADATSHNCPVCEAPLSDALLESQEMLYCTRCHGMLIDMRTFPLLAQSLREHGYGFRGSQAPRAIDAVNALHCPLWKREMNTRHLPGGVMIDMSNCLRCLMLWLDHAELGRIAAA